MALNIISLSQEQLCIMSKISEQFGDNSFERGEIEFLFYICNVLGQKSDYTNCDYLAKLKSMLSISSQKIPEVKLSRLKIEFPEVDALIKTLERRQEYFDSII